MVNQFEIVLPEMKRGFHLVTSVIEKHLHNLPENGILNLFIRHTSAAIAINENADTAVRYDFKTFIDHLVPDGYNLFTHRLEGDDDMPAHIKSSLFGQSLTIPIKIEMIETIPIEPMPISTH